MSTGTPVAGGLPGSAAGGLPNSSAGATPGTSAGGAFGTDPTFGGGGTLGGGASGFGGTGGFGGAGSFGGAGTFGTGGFGSFGSFGGFGFGSPGAGASGFGGGPFVLPIAGAASFTDTTNDTPADPADTTGGAGDAGAPPAPSEGADSGAPVPADPPLLVPVGQAEPARAWTAIRTLLEAGDQVVAFSGAADRAAWIGISTSVRTDAPGAVYFVALPDVPSIEAALRDGTPATLAGLGLSTVVSEASSSGGPGSSPGIDDAQLGAVEARVHAAGKAFFVSVSSSTTLAPPVLARADVLEIVPEGAADAEVAAQTVRPLIDALRAAGARAVFVRVPASIATASLSVAAETLAARLPGVGIALPAPAGAPDLLARMRGIGAARTP
jgi:hypothetical protein